MGLTVLRPSASATATCAVTSLPHWLTPSATTPLSAQKTSSFFRSSRISGDPVSAAMRTRSSSKSPRLPRGLARLSQRRRAAAAAASSGGLIV